MKKTSLVSSLSTTIGLGVTAAIGSVSAQTTSGIVFYEANNSNTQVGNMSLGQQYLGNAVFDTNEALFLGPNEFKFGAILFTATQSGSFVFGQQSAPTDTVMMLFQGVFDPLDPGIGKLTGNDDTPEYIHRSILGDQAAETIMCSTVNWCPMITQNVTEGETYTLLVTHYHPSQSTLFDLPLSFYSNGNPIFYEYSTNSPIDRQRSYYLSSDVGSTVTPLFVGGTLRIAPGTTNENNNYRLSNINTNTIDLQNANTTFSGNFSDNNVAQPGLIRFINGKATLAGDNTHTGETIIGSNAEVTVSSDSNLGGANAAVTLDSGTIKVTGDLTTERVVNTIADTTSTIQVNANKVWHTAGISGSGDLQFTGDGTVQVNGGESFDGNLNIQKGTLEVNSESATTNNVVASIQAPGTLSISKSNTFDQISNQGRLEFHNVNNQNARVDVVGNYSQSATATFYSDLATQGSNVLLHADQANLSGNLVVDYFDGEAVAHTNWTSSSQVADTTSKVYTLIDTDAGITGDFAQVKIDNTVITGGQLKMEGIPDADYVEYLWTVGKTADQKQYQISGEYNLRWLQNDATYEGQFSVKEGNTFKVDDSSLIDQTGTFNNWDGKSLTKKDQGTLTIAKAQTYTGNTTVKAGSLFWGIENSGLPVNIQTLTGNYVTEAGATTGLSQANTFLNIGGNFFLAGDNCTDINNSCFDLNNPLNIQNGSASRAELVIIPGGSGTSRPEIIVDQQADIKGAYLNVQGLGSANLGEIFHASNLQANRSYKIIHAKKGFVGSDVNGGSNATAGFVNTKRPLLGIDYVTGGKSEIVNCSATPNPCAIQPGDDPTRAQEYVISELELAWNYGGVTGTATPNGGNKTGNFTIIESADFEVDVVLANQDQGTDAAPDGSGNLGFQSAYGWWDGKSLTKKGVGTLHLSNINTYSGVTDIREGTLSIADQSNIGSSSKIQLGNKNSDSGATLEFAKSPLGSQSPNLNGLNITNTITVGNAIELAERADNTIKVTAAGDTVILNGALTSQVNNYQANTAMSGTSWIKSGDGTLVVNYQPGVATYGDTWVQEGKLTLEGDLSQIQGNIYNESELEFHTLTDTTWNGEVNNSSPRSRAASNGSALKTGSAKLQLKGDSYTDWQVDEGTLDIANTTFNSDVTLAAGSVLSFSQNSTTPIETANYTGKITADTASTILMDRANSSLNFNFSNDSVIGKVRVAEGQLNFLQYNALASTLSAPLVTPYVAPTRVTVDSLEADAGGTISLYGKDTYLTVTNEVTLKSGSTLEVTLDPDNPNNSKINAKDIIIEPNAEMDILGFAFDNGLGNLLNSGRAAADVVQNVFKASDLLGVDFTVLASTNPISGSFSNQGTIVNRPSYLLYTNYFTPFGSDPSYPNEYHVGSFELAWNSGNPNFGNGTFDLAPLTAINIDLPLADQTGPFDNWDGKTLTKTEDGLLVLSEVNTYTGNTNIKGGEITLAIDNSIADSRGVFIENNGVLSLLDNTQTIQQLQSTSAGSAVDLMNRGDLIITNNDGSATPLESVFAGNIIGGVDDGTSNSQLVVQQGAIRLSGQSLIDQVILENGADLTLSGTKSRLFTQELKVDNSDITVGPDSRLRAFIHDSVGDSSLTIENTGTWHMLASSEIQDLTLNGGNVLFGNHAVAGAAGRTLTVGQWNATNGNLSLQTDLDSLQNPRLDTVVINDGATGVTHVSIIDKGGFQALLATGNKILPIESGGGVGILPTNAFDGGLTSGGYAYRLVYDPETGGFMLERAPLVSGDHQLREDAVDGITNGARATAVTTLGNLSMLDFGTIAQQARCETGTVFGNLGGQVGNYKGKNGYESDQSRTTLQLGGDIAAQEMGEGCTRYGLLAGYNRSSSNVDGTLLDGTFGKLGKNSTDTYYVGGYARYESGNDWYVNTALVAAFDSTDIKPNGANTSTLDGQSTIATAEFGTHIPLAENTRITPSVQLMVQSTSLDEKNSATNYDRVNATFARAGATLEHTIENDVTLQVRANVWHQFNSDANITYGIGQSPDHKVGDKTWTDLQVGVAAKLSESTTLDFSLGYQGDFGSDNAITGKIGLNYRW